MNSNRPAAVLALYCALCLAGCSGSPQYRYYLLTAPEFAPAAEGGPAIGVGPVEVAEYLAGDELIYRLDGNELQVARSAQWAEPLAAGIARVLALNLARLLETQDIRRFPWQPRNAPQFAVKVRVLELDTSAAQATLVAQWLLYRPADGATLTRRISRLRTPLTPSDALPGSIAPAYSALLEELGTELAAALGAAMDADGTSAAASR